MTRYSEKLRLRIERLLEGSDTALDEPGLLREVAFFADRCDINEEVSRLTQHVREFNRTMRKRGPKGKMLEFVAQEMLREANTIGSKANDFGLAREVVKIKTAIEQIKEQVANVYHQGSGYIRSVHTIQMGPCENRGFRFSR